MTDANLLLGRLIPDYFPKIFGKSEKEPLDVQASRTGFEKLMKEINESDSGGSIGLDEVVYGSVFHLLVVALAASHIKADHGICFLLMCFKIHQSRKRNYVQTNTGANRSAGICDVGTYVSFPVCLIPA